MTSFLLIDPHIRSRPCQPKDAFIYILPPHRLQTMSLLIPEQLRRDCTCAADWNSVSNFVDAHEEEVPAVRWLWRTNRIKEQQNCPSASTVRITRLDWRESVKLLSPVTCYCRQSYQVIPDRMIRSHCKIKRSS